MTLRLRKKPPTTALTHTATAPSSQTSLQGSVASLKSRDLQVDCEFTTSEFAHGRRKNFSAASIIALAFVLVSLGSALPAEAEEASTWSPSRPKRTLSSTKVKQATPPKVDTKTSKGWKTASGSKSVNSARLQWTGPKPSTQTKSKAPTATLKQAQSKTQMPRRVVVERKLVAKPAQPGRVPIWAQESSTPARPRTPPAKLLPTKLADRLSSVKHQPALQASSPAKFQAQSKPKSQTQLQAKSQTQLQATLQPKPQATTQPIRQVQNVEELRLPIASLREPEHVAASIPKVVPNIANGFAAPSPDDVFSTDAATPIQQPVAHQFKDQTPSFETKTREVQAPSRFDSFDSLPSLNTPAESQPIQPEANPFEPEANPFEPPNADPPAVTQEPLDLPVPQSQRSSDNLFDTLPDTDDSTAPPAPTTEDNGSDIERIKQELKDLEKLPTLDGEEEKQPKNPLGGEEEESPLFSEEDPDKERLEGELAATNGRDFEAEAAACRADFEYLKRRERTDMSLNISPSLSPTEVDMAKAEQTRIEKLAKAPVWTWRDRSGSVIVEGKLDDYRNDKIVVRTVNGTTRSIPHHTLSDRERRFVASWWELPAECNFEGEQYAMRDFRLTTFTWTAAGTCHKPLYYEQVGVERYGHSSGPIVQPLVSGVHFFGDILMAPYHAGINPPNECQYTLGYYRPGDCAPWLVPGFPFTARGFKWEGLAIGAAIALLP